MMAVYTCDKCPYTPGCGSWGFCSVTCGDGLMFQQTLNGSCKSSDKCNNGPCFDTTTPVVTTSKATTDDDESEESSEIDATNIATTSQTDLVTNGRNGPTFLSRVTTTQANNDITGGTEVSNKVPPEDAMLAVKVAVPVVAAVVIIAVVLVFMFLRRKRRNDASHSAKALDIIKNVPGIGAHPYSEDNVAFTPDYDIALEDMAYTYVQSHTSEKDLRDHTYAKQTKSYQAFTDNVGGMAASSDPEYDYTCGNQMALVGHEQAVYNHLHHGQLMNNTSVSDSTYDTNQFPMIQHCKSDTSDYDHIKCGVAKTTGNHGDDKSYDHLPNPEQALPKANSQTLDPTYNQLGPVGSKAAFKHRDLDQLDDHPSK